MMPFSATPGGWVSSLEPHELDLIARAATEVAAVLDPPIIDPHILGALTDDDVPVPEPHDRSLSNLLRPMASDPQLAGELRTLSEDDLRADKARRLRIFIDELREAAKSQGLVYIRSGEEWTWLSALTDIRLALAGTLDAQSPADVDAVTDYALRVAAATDPAEIIDDSELDPLVATVFTMLGAWRESLLSAMDGREGSR